MHQVRKFKLWSVALGAAVTLFAGTLAASAQAPTHTRRETNASREARIRRTILDTYSHRWEVFGGGGYLRWNSGEYTQKNNEVSWAASGNYFLNSKLSIIGQAQGSFGNAKAMRFIGFPQIPDPQINEYFFMGGPSYRFYERQKVALSAQGTAGVGWGIFSGGSKGIPSTQLGLWPDGWRPAFSLAVSGDYNFYPNLAFRVTPTYLITTFGSQVQNNLGINAGILYRFGRR
jgi:hypothetical protein